MESYLAIPLIHSTYQEFAATWFMMEISTASNITSILTIKIAGLNGTPIHPLYSICIYIYIT